MMLSSTASMNGGISADLSILYIFFSWRKNNDFNVNDIYKFAADYSIKLGRYLYNYFLNYFFKDFFNICDVSIWPSLRGIYLTLIISLFLCLNC